MPIYYSEPTVHLDIIDVRIATSQMEGGVA